MTFINYIKDQRRILLRRLKLRPVNTVFRRLSQYGWKKFPSGLEVFGHTGEYHTMNYQHLVDDLHVWEFRQECEEPLKSNLPHAKIRITDSYKEIRTIDKKFDLVVIDNHQGIFGDDYCEHFEMLPLVFPVLKGRAVLVVNVLPDLDELRKMYPGDYTQHLERRAKWYQTSNPAQPGEKFLLDFYTKYTADAGFRLDFIFITKRNKVVSYLSMGLSRLA